MNGINKLYNIVSGSFFLALFFLLFLAEIVISGWKVGILVLKGYKGNDGTFVDYTVQGTNSWHILLLFNIISMTPGSLSVDISDDNSTIHVHLLHVKEKESFIANSIKMEKLLFKVFGTSKQA